jgi:cytochrome b pre-mRNA-processing protein 3
MTETYVAYGVCEQLIKECIKVADYDIPQRHNNFKEQPPRSADGQDIGVGKGWWYEDFGLLPTFNTWAQITFLHMYLLTTRFRLFPSDHAPTWHQHLINHFSYAAEERMTTHHNVVARMMRNRVLKDLFAQWRGIHAAYDTALVQGDTQLAAAVWRNVGKGDENVDLRRLTEVVAFVRSGCKALEGLSDEVVAKGDVIFGDPGSERDVVRVRSPLMESLGMDLRKEQSASPAKLRADPATPATPATATSDVDELERRAMESAAKTAGPA